MMITTLADALRSYGLTVIESNGWLTRGHGQMSGIRGVLCHHTAGPASGNTPSLNVVTYGRSDLPGPLCNLYLARDGTWYTIAAGLGYHAGSGGPLGNIPANEGNNYMIGIEAESTGYGDWTRFQATSYPMGVAALCSYYKLPSPTTWGHMEWTSRKIDPAQWPGGMNGFRSQVQSYMDGKPITPTQPMTNEELTEMIVAQDTSNGDLFLISGNCKLLFPQGGGDPSTAGKGNVYADVLLGMLAQAYPNGGKPALVALEHDVATRIPDAWTFVDGAMQPYKMAPPDFAALKEAIQP